MLEQEHAGQSSRGITTTVLEQPNIETLKDLSDEAIDTLVTYFATVPSALTAAVIEQ